jgi:hypothetical protein
MRHPSIAALYVVDVGMIKENTLGNIVVVRLIVDIKVYPTDLVIRDFDWC